jgi:hypothetical protein
VVAADDGQRAGGGDAERVHRFRTEEFADARTQHRAAVAAARVGGAAGALELHFPAFAGGILYFAQQDRAAVAQLRDVMAELVTGIERRDRVHSRQQLVAGQRFDQFRARHFARVEVEQASASGL